MSSIVSKIKTSKQHVKTKETVTIQVYAYSAREEAKGYYLAFRLNSPKLKT